MVQELLEINEKKAHQLSTGTPTHTPHTSVAANRNSTPMASRPQSTLTTPLGTHSSTLTTPARTSAPIMQSSSERTSIHPNVNRDSAPLPLILPNHYMSDELSTPLISQTNTPAGKGADKRHASPTDPHSAVPNSSTQRYASYKYRKEARII